MGIQQHSGAATATLADDINSVAEMLRFIPAEDRDTWLRVGMALHHETGGSAAGEALWDQWSRVSEKFDVTDQRQAWRSFRSKSGGVTGATIAKLATEGGYRNGGTNGNHQLAGKTGVGAKKVEPAANAERPPTWTDVEATVLRDGYVFVEAYVYIERGVVYGEKFRFHHPNPRPKRERRFAGGTAVATC